MVVGEVVGMVGVAMVEIAAVVAMVETVAVVVDMEVVVMEVSKLCFRDYDQNLGCLKKYLLQGGGGGYGGGGY